MLEAGCVYLVPLIEQLKLRSTIAGFANPKSSTGRLDVFTRLIADRQDGFDASRKAIRARCSPRSARAPSPSRFATARGSTRSGSAAASASSSMPTSSRGRVGDRALREIHSDVGLVEGEAAIRDGLNLSISLAPVPPSGLVGYRARRYAGVIDVDEIGAYDVGQYWEEVRLGNDHRLVLDPHEFYILASKESVSVPPAYVAEMAPFDPLIGEYRVHYAGFFDPGFGYTEGKAPGAKAVLEVRSLDIPFILEDGQIVGRLVYDKLTDIPDRSTAGHRLALPGARPEAVEALQAGLGRAAAAAEHAELGAMRMAELDRAGLEHAAIGARGFGQRLAHLEGRIVGKQRAGQHDRSRGAFALHHHAARGAHHVVRVLVQDAPAALP